MSEPEPKQNLDLLNTEIAFSNKSDKEFLLQKPSSETPSFHNFVEENPFWIVRKS
jgi:hypothetical protein